MAEAEHKCPSCSTVLVKADIPRRRSIYRCPKENTLYRLKQKRRNRFNPDDPSTWRATCAECGYKAMKYYNYRYHCDKCGNTLYV